MQLLAVTGGLARKSQSQQFGFGPSERPERPARGWLPGFKSEPPISSEVGGFFMAWGGSYGLSRPAAAPRAFVGLRLSTGQTVPPHPLGRSISYSLHRTSHSWRNTRMLLSPFQLLDEVAVNLRKLVSGSRPRVEKALGLVAAMMSEEGLLGRVLHAFGDDAQL